jgi:hypothetical protein
MGVAMSKQTAVEWLEQEFIKLESTVGVFGVMYELIEKAKEMEKEQKIHFSKKCLDKALDTDIRTAHLKIEQYYGETYGGKNG